MAVRVPYSTPALIGLALLWLAVLGSALGVVYSTHRARQELQALQALQREAARHRVTWGQYLLEQSTWSAFGRVERMAAERLQMQVPETDNIVVVEE